MMKVHVISYSLTGNNNKLATALASKISAEHTVIAEKAERSNGQTAMEMLFGRTPKTSPSEIKAEESDLLLFVCPVWMGQPASPFRGILKSIRNQKVPYAFISISGGALGPNKRLSRGLKKRTGRKPEAVIDFQIAKLFLDKAKAKETSAYSLTEEDVERLTGMVMDEVGDILNPAP